MGIMNNYRDYPLANQSLRTLFDRLRLTTHKMSADLRVQFHKENLGITVIKHHNLASTEFSRHRFVNW
jgi:hypothetical protein